ncbi:MAG: lysophospholipid acyltransferase family protein [Aquificota bacterium]|nr:lysophospholipid acyltransferase family protein [Aquificota bacterium]
MTGLKFRLVLTLTPALVPLVRILGRSIRWRKRYDFTRDRGKIYALWHGHALGLALFGMDRGIYTMASRFADGEIATRILKGLGFEVVRGSTEEGRAEKGGRTGILKLMDVLRKGKNVAITVDGPKGPPFKVKKGVIFLAQKTGAPIVPAVVRFRSFLELRSWDRFLIPYPFTEGEVIVGDEIRVSPEDDPEERRSELERTLIFLSSLEGR